MPEGRPLPLPLPLPLGAGGLPVGSALRRIAWWPSAALSPMGRCNFCQLKNSSILNLPNPKMGGGQVTLVQAEA